MNLLVNLEINDRFTSCGANEPPQATICNDAWASSFLLPANRQPEPQGSCINEAVPCATPPKGGVGQVLFVEPFGGGAGAALDRRSFFVFGAEPGITHLEPPRYPGMFMALSRSASRAFRQRHSAPHSPRSGQTSPVVIGLLVAILLALIVLIFWPSPPIPQPPPPPPEAKPIVVAAGTTAKREDLPNPPPPPAKPIANDQRIKETVQAGKTYHTVLKVGFQCRAEDSDWGAKLVTNLTYVGEFVVDRHIESNDGKRVIEVRHFVSTRNVKVVSEVEQLKIDFGPAGTPILVALELYAPGSGAAFMSTTPVVEAIFGAAADVMLKDATAKAVGRVDSLSGKKVRIVYVDGIGVESVTPLDSGLTEDERDFVFSTAVLSDCNILPELTTKPGEYWKVDGAEFAGLFDPTWRGTPTGDVTIVRDPNQTINGQRVCQFWLAR